MKSTPFPAGDFKLKGKKTCLLACGCCVAQNFKWSERWKQAEKEINQSRGNMPLRQQDTIAVD